MSDSWIWHFLLILTFISKCIASTDLSLVSRIVRIEGCRCWALTESPGLSQRGIHSWQLTNVLKANMCLYDVVLHAFASAFCSLGTLKVEMNYWKQTADKPKQPFTSKRSMQQISPVYPLISFLSSCLNFSGFSLVFSFIYVFLI